MTELAVATRSVPPTWWSDVRRVATIAAVLAYAGEVSKAETDRALAAAKAGRGRR